jgi:two-component system, NtrC family, sensor histidine kinase HydH
MPRRWPQHSLTAQIGLVTLLFGASLLSLAITVLLVVRRETRGASAQRNLRNAGRKLAENAGQDLALVPPFGGSREEWDQLNDGLSTRSNSVLASFDGVEGGYYVLEGGKFLGAAFPTKPPSGSAKRSERRRSPDPPPLEYDLIETQVHSSIRKRQDSFVVQAVPPSTVAIYTVPVVIEGRTV